MNFDKHGVLGQIQPDGSIEGGDSANWYGQYIYLTQGKRRFPKFFEVSFGAYVRHPDIDQTNNSFGAYYINPWAGCISRDQLTGILAALIGQKEYLASLRLILHHACWLFLFAYNTITNGQVPRTTKWKWPDVTLLNIWALELRAFGWFSWLFYPLLLIFDLHDFVNTIIHRFKIKKDPISYAMRLIICRENVPTLISLLSWVICDKDKLIKEIETYWGGWRDQAFLTKFYAGRLRR